MQKTTIIVLLAMIALASAATQVLVWKTEEDENPSLVTEWKNSKNLDCTFVSSVLGESKEKVSAHKAIVAKYSPYLKNLIKTSRNPIEVQYRVKVIKSLVTLMYKHEVEVDESELEDIMNAAKEIHVDEMIWKRRGDYKPHKANPIIIKNSNRKVVPVT